MRVLGEVVAQVLAFSSRLLMLADIGVGLYMRVSQRAPFTGKAMPQPRSNLQLYYWIRESDLGSSNFDNYWIVLQCS